VSQERGPIEDRSRADEALGALQPLSAQRDTRTQAIDLSRPMTPSSGTEGKVSNTRSRAARAEVT
jgi:hypothetical protein